MPGPEQVEAFWRNGRLDGRPGRTTVLFGRMHEDWSIEVSLFPPGSRVLCIASAGCTALALAERGDRVTAVDINPAQIDYVRARLAGMPAKAGRVDLMLMKARRALRWLGWNEAKLRDFLTLGDPTEQMRFWRQELDGPLWRTALECALHPLVLRSAYAPGFLRALPDGFARVIRRRLERGWLLHANRTNPYAWHMLLGHGPPEEGSSTISCGHLKVNLICAEVAEYLEICTPASFDAFSLSNILDGADAQYRQRLLCAVRRAGAPEAVVVLRSFAEPKDKDEDSWAARDRALIWGSVRVFAIAPAGESRLQPERV